MPDEALTYKDAGVNIDEAYRALRGVSADIQSTYNENVITGLGAFGGLIHANFPGYEHPVLVSSIDGVGTKTKVAAMARRYQGLGHDIVNHCVNDILCQGAKPLFFLDYFGTSNLSGQVLEDVLRGVSEACRASSCVLLGGETAEMPGIYAEGDFDLVGTIVGVVEFEKRLPKPCDPGDALIGIASSGLHTNGFSLARRALFELKGYSLDEPVPGTGTTIGEELLRPHKSYFKAVHSLLQDDRGVKGIAHITGGGFYDNVPRALPSNVQAVIDKRSWTPLPIFKMIQEAGGISESEMHRAFNMGIGMVLVVDKEASAGIIQHLQLHGEAAAIIGHVQPGPHDVQIV